ncbi:hypothetical protein RirG_204730 [Rhizophagus irregularis DAOM 197198w]|uniref:Reverse transcriptase n=1 Tax=Rhizophagus irregularis (strain DAOM 197198w) TaxID=1432141 RepID=A0A015IKL2_RHIIW|nr:hypothetical protein RirG_204730 [Rhizophagus irregularis DAOM 197198w]
MNLITVATLNIRQLNDIKVQNLADYLEKNDIDILSITETRITNKKLKFITQNKFMNHQVFGTVGVDFNGSGTLIIMKKELAKHISKMDRYKGRILKIELTFSEQQKLAIISVYNKSGDRGKVCVETRIDINKNIMKMIKDSKQKNQQIILMGDFNLQYKKYLKQKNSNRTRVSEQLKIFELLENMELYDVCKEVLNIDDLALTKNHVTHITKKMGSRIDYIWVTKKIFEEIIQVNIKEYDSKNDTDHKIISFKVTRNTVLPSIVYNKKKQRKSDKRIKYFYDRIDEEIKDAIKVKAKQELNERKNRMITTTITLDEKIKLYEDVINATKNSEIEKKEIYLTNEKEDTSVKDLELYRIVRFFISLRRKFKKKKGIKNVKQHWKKNISHVDKILKKWNVDGFYYLRSYRFGNVQIKKYIAKLDELYEIFQLKLQVKVSTMKEDKIKHAIEQRQKDLEDNQRRMIDNVMDREFKKITIDRVLSTNSKGEDILIVDEDKIKEKVADHFQNCAGSISIDKEIPEDWKEEYNPRTQPHVPSFAYDKVLEKISIDEILEVAKDLPSGKASGPSGITYEDIKLTILPLKDHIQEIFNDIMDTEEIPKQWLKANIYPIPKPKPWGYDLNNTRPITLLETLRKMFMKIITNRLSDAMVKYNILRGHQFAGLPKKSTFEPLRIIKELIDYANEENKELWFFLVDMSKAYDRVNIFMLRKAMKRIKIPEKLCNIIIGMFQGRTNQVFTPAGLTKPFEMKTGIDQGEIISPLLWIIFYDPLLERLRKSNLGFKISAKEQLDIYEGLTREKQLRFPACGYMDDTSFLTGNKLDMEKILKIADSFYTLNDIKINKKKSALLIRFKKRKRLNKEIKLSFGNEEVEIQPVKHNGSERFLGVWINMYNKSQHIQQQVKNEVMLINKAFTTKKGLTDKMMIYLFNYLIIPIVEYRTQLTVMDERIMEKLMSPFRKVLKNKLKMACTAPNAILETNYIYNLNSFTNNQLQAKITNFVLQINDKGILGEIMDIRLTSIQNLLLLENNPLYTIDNKTSHVIKKFYNESFTMRNILLMRDNDFDLEKDDGIVERFKVEGGPTTVRLLISEDTYVNNFKFLQDNNIRYIDQLLSPSKRYLLTIKELEDKKYVKLSLKGRLSANINNYDQIIKELTMSPHTYKLKNHIINQIDGIDRVENLRGTELIPVMANMKKDVPIIIEVNIGGNLQAVFGRTRKVLPGGHLIAMHMVPITTIEDKDLILEKCPGCNAATWLDVPEVMFSHLERVRIPCIIMTNVRNASTFSRNKWQNGINQGNILGQERTIFPGISGQVIQENFIYDRILKQQPWLYKSTYSKMYEIISKDKISFIDDMISQFLEVGAYRPMTNRLQLCKNRLTTARGAKLNIYIDGSVKNNKTENIEAIFGLMIYDEDNKLLDTIMSTVENWITVNKTEALALLAALLIIPENKKATIYTDSQTNYNNFMDIKQRPHRNNLRDILKFGSSNYIWAIIKEIISKEKLDIEVIKIKAHATDTLHNILDIEIKERYVDIHNVNKLEVLPTCKEYRYVLRWNETIVETNIRRFIRLITRIQGLEKFFNLNRNDKYRMLEIDWHVTFEYLNVNEEYETYFKTNAHSSKCKRMKYKD